MSGRGLAVAAHQPVCPHPHPGRAVRRPNSSSFDVPASVVAFWKLHRPRKLSLWLGDFCGVPRLQPHLGTFTPSEIRSKKLATTLERIIFALGSDSLVDKIVFLVNSKRQLPMPLQRDERKSALEQLCNDLAAKKEQEEEFLAACKRRAILRAYAEALFAVFDAVMGSEVEVSERPLTRWWRAPGNVAAAVNAAGKALDELGLDQEGGKRRERLGD